MDVNIEYVHIHVRIRIHVWISTVTKGLYIHSFPPLSGSVFMSVSVSVSFFIFIFMNFFFFNHCNEQPSTPIFPVFVDNVSTFSAYFWPEKSTDNFRNYFFDVTVNGRLTALMTAKDGRERKTFSAYRPEDETERITFSAYFQPFDGPDQLVVLVENKLASSALEQLL